MGACIFPGRFQPFHTGHLMVVKGMMTTCDKTVIAICSGDHRDDDLFTTDQVREMISAALLEENIVDAMIVEVTDDPDDAQWADKVLEAAGWPEQGKIWSGDESVRALFESIEKETQKISLVPGFDGAEIRKMIAEKDSAWRTKVPAGAMDVVYNVINKDAQ